MQTCFRALVLTSPLAVAANAPAAESISVSFGPDPMGEAPLPIRMASTTSECVHTSR
jgi:hypothetical protein